MSNSIQLAFGLRASDNSLVHISNAEQGNGCNCVCPVCKSALVAKKGTINTHHFAHTTVTDCQYAAETVTHLAAKDVLAKAGYIVVPKHVLNLFDTVRNGYKSEYVRTDRKIVEAQKIVFDDVRIDHVFQDIAPDLLVTVSGEDLLIEIFVTHKVDAKKLNKIRMYSLPALEIDMQDILSLPNTDEFEAELIERTDSKAWLFHPRQVAAENVHQSNIDAIKSDNNPKIRQYNRPWCADIINKQRSNANNSMRMELELKIELEGKLFYKKNGRWPDSDEAQQIINRIKYGKSPEKEQQTQTARDYFYKKNGRWPDKEEYDLIISSLNKA